MVLTNLEVFVFSTHIYKLKQLFTEQLNMLKMKEEKCQCLLLHVEEAVFVFSMEITVVKGEVRMSTNKGFDWPIVILSLSEHFGISYYPSEVNCNITWIQKISTTQGSDIGVLDSLT